MELVLLELSNVCNLQCPGCANATSTRPKGRMDLARFAEIAAEIAGKPKLRKKRVALHGFGEPTINPDLLEYLHTLDTLGFRNVDFASNGTELDRVLPALASVKCLSWVRVSLNSSRKETHEKINRGSDFAAVCGNIKRLVALSPPFRVVVQHLVGPETKDETEADFRKLIPGNWRYMRKRMHNYAGQSTIGNVKSNRRRCPNGWYGRDLIVQWDGDLVGCCSDNGKSQVYGNAAAGLFSKATIQERRKREREFRARNFTRLPLCKRCLGKAR